MRLVKERMTNEEKFDRIFQVLTGAYMDNTLQPGSPCACAVGNLVAYAMYNRVEFLKEGGIDSDLPVWKIGSPSWGHLFYTLQKDTSSYKINRAIDESKVIQENDTHCQVMRKDLDDVTRRMANYELGSTGLPLEVLLGIEFQFETNSAYGRSREDKMFKGLNAVLNYLSVYFGLSEPKKTQATTTLQEIFA